MEWQVKREIKGLKPFVLGILLVCGIVSGLTGCGQKDKDTIVLRVSNWEEYIDQGEWEEDEAIELEDGTVIFGENSLVQDFEEWFYETYGKRVVVEYSTFGTNEELYNQLTMGDSYDLVCPSEYMIMKMIEEGMVVPYSSDFFDVENENNYYVNNISPYIRDVFDNLSIGDKILSDYGAGYMWGTLGIVYNPEYITEEEAAHWRLLLSPDVSKRITIKDSVRDAYFAGNSIYNEDLISGEEFVNSPDYTQRLSEILNATDEETVKAVEDVLSYVKDNVYSFETDSGKADMVTGKVLANQQWSGDAVYTMDQAEEDGVCLNYSAPEEATNLWFDGWVMLEVGIDGDKDRQMAAEAFVNFLSMPENAVRNMYYIGYTSVIAGKSQDAVRQYVDWCYGAEDEEEDVAEYDITYFFEGAEAQTNEEYVIITPEEQVRRQLFAQYPTLDVVKRSVVMAHFDKEGNERINRMWTNVRCFDLKKWWERLSGSTGGKR